MINEHFRVADNCLLIIGFCQRSSGVEHFLGKEEVVGSIPIVGSKETYFIFAYFINYFN
jgi:hypothetical protein